MDPDVHIGDEEERTVKYATCSTHGSYERVVYCKVCGEELSRETITKDLADHKDEDEDGSCDTCSEPLSKDGLWIREIRDQIYTGSAILPAIEVRDVTRKLVPNRDYTVKITANTNVGTALVTVTGKGDYAGKETATFAILPRVIGGDEFEADVILKEKATVLEKERDYILVYDHHTEVGTASVTIIGRGKYIGTRKIDFKITGTALSKATVAGLPASVRYVGDDFVLGGYQLYLKATKTAPQVDLVEGKDYTLSYRNNTAVNDGGGRKQPTVVITLKGNFSGKIEKSFAITPHNIEYTYAVINDVIYQNKTNAYQTKAAVYEYNGRKLTAKQDYDNTFQYRYTEETTVANHGATVTRQKGDPVEKDDIVPAGTTLEIRINGKGNYEGEFTTEYRIVKASIASAKVSVPVQTYTGGEIRPLASDIKVMVGKTLLTPGIDYVIEGYVNNVNKGKATVYLRGINNYGGYKVQNFTIASKLLDFIR